MNSRLCRDFGDSLGYRNETLSLKTMQKNEEGRGCKEDYGHPELMYTCTRALWDFLLFLTPF